MLKSEGRSRLLIAQHTTLAPISLKIKAEGLTVFQKPPMRPTFYMENLKERKIEGRIESVAVSQAEKSFHLSIKILKNQLYTTRVYNKKSPA